MRDLLKADFRRVRKDKLLLVVGILAAAFAIMTPGLYALLFSFIGWEEGTFLFPNNAYAKNHFFGAFSVGNDFGLVCPILMAIVLFKDFSQGTIRNKIISGKSRVQIFLSLFITCAVVMIGIILLHAILTLCFSLLFFEYQSAPFDGWDLLYLLESILFEIFVLLFYSAILSWLCVCMKNVGVVIILFIAFSLLLPLIGFITGTAHSIMEATDGNQSTISILHFITRINVGRASSYIGIGYSYDLEDVLYLTFPPLIGSAGFAGLGLLHFRKKDLK